MTETRVRLRHLKPAGYCARGARYKLSILGLDWRGFVKDGIPVSELQRFDDAQVKRMIEVAQKEADGK